MFDLFSGSHLLILLTVLLVVVGPKDLPRLMRTMGQWTGKARRMAGEFKKSFDDMARQEELDKLRLEIDELRKTNMDAAELSRPPSRVAASYKSMKRRAAASSRSVRRRPALLSRSTTRRWMPFRKASSPKPNRRRSPTGHTSRDSAQCGR